MKILYPNPEILNTRCDGRDNTREQCSCVPFRKRWLGKARQKQGERCRDF